MDQPRKEKRKENVSSEECIHFYVKYVFIYVIIVTLILVYVQMTISEGENTPNRRGPTKKNNINNKKAKGIKRNIKFNDKGQPIGKAYSEMQSYLGVKTRRTVSLNYKDWRQVPQELKNRIWEDVYVRKYFNYFNILIIFMNYFAFH